MKRGIILLSVLSLALLALSGCSAEKFGAGIDSGAPVMKIKDIFLDSASSGRRVTLSGKISSQCGSSGCWFVLQDDTGQVFINLAPHNMTLPPRMSRSASVTGTVTSVQGELQIAAEGVEVR